MTGPCSADFQRLAAELGGFGCDGNPVMDLHNPLGLDHPTMLVIEVAMLVGAALALRHAIRRRRQGDPTTLAIWIAAVAYLVILEPPLYFPEVFGLQEQVGLIFVHNQFSVQFLFDRLPLYIVSIYPVMAVLSYELVRSLGVFQRRRLLTSAVTVGVVYHVFYEFFDHVGPQLRWWIWNPTAPTNEPFFASVPLGSMVNFALAGPIVLTLVVRLLVSRHPEAATLSSSKLVGRSALAGLLIPAGLVLAGIPVTLAGGFGEVTNHGAQAVLYWALLAAASIVAVAVLVDAHRHRSTAPVLDRPTRRYLTTHAAIYLGAVAVSWAAALPAYAAAVDGITGGGTPIGSLPYALACLAASLGVTWMAVAGRPAVATSADVEIGLADAAPVVEA